MLLNQSLTGLGRSVAVAATILLGTAALASAATLKLTTTFDVAVRPAGVNAPAGPDTIGLDGAKITATAIFADGTVFTSNGTSAPRAVASEFSYTISGASVAATNGTYLAGTTTGAPTSVGLFFATSNDGFFTDGPGSNIFTPSPDFANLSILNLGLPNTLKFTANGTTGGPVALGSALTLAQLQTISFGSALDSFSTRAAGGTNYAISGFVTTASVIPDVAPVPLPAALPLMLAGLGGLGGLSVLRRRRIAA